MFLVVIGVLVACAIVGAYLVDRHDRRNGHTVGSGPEFRARFRAAKRQRRDQVWGRKRSQRLPDPTRLYNDESRARRSH